MSVLAAETQKAPVTLASGVKQWLAALRPPVDKKLVGEGDVRSKLDILNLFPLQS